MWQHMFCVSVMCAVWRRELYSIFQYVYLSKKIYKMGCLEGSGVPVLYIGRTLPKV